MHILATTMSDSTSSPKNDEKIETVLEDGKQDSIENGDGPENSGLFLLTVNNKVYN